MANAAAIDELFISIGLDTEALRAGLQQVGGFLDMLDGGVKNFATGLEKGIAETEGTTAALKKTGEAGAASMRRVASEAEKTGYKVGGLTGRVKTLFKTFIGPIGGALAVGSIFSKYLSEADSLGKFANSIGENIQTIDAWGQAAGLAGGSAEGMNATIQSLTRSLAEVGTLGTGRAKAAFDELKIKAKDSSGNIRKATDVLMELAEKAETMNKAEFVGLLTKMGIDQGTIMLLQTGKKSVSELVSEMKKLAYTEADSRTTEVFNDRLQILKKSLMKLASEILRYVVPALDALAKALIAVFGFLREHGEFAAMILGIIGLALSGKLAAGLKAATVATWAFWRALLANPLTWLVGFLVLVAVALEDMIVWLQGGEAQWSGFWEAMASGGDWIYDKVQQLKQEFDQLYSDIQKWPDEFMYIAQVIGDKVLAALEKVKAKAKEIIDVIKAPGAAAGDWLYDTIHGGAETLSGANTQARTAVAGGSKMAVGKLDNSTNVQASITNHITAQTNDPAALAGLAGDATKRALVNTVNPGVKQ